MFLDHTLSIKAHFGCTEDAIRESGPSGIIENVIYGLLMTHSPPAMR